MLLLFRQNLNEAVQATNSSSGQGFLFLTHLVQAQAAVVALNPGGGGRGNRIDYYELMERRRLKQQREEEEIMIVIAAFLATRKAA